MAMFTAFERDEDARVGVMWAQFVDAVSMYVYTNEVARPVFVADVAMAFNTTLELAREAAERHPWLHISPDSQITSDGD